MEGLSYPRLYPAYHCGSKFPPGEESQTFSPGGKHVWHQPLQMRVCLEGHYFTTLPTARHAFLLEFTGMGFDPPAPEGSYFCRSLLSRPAGPRLRGVPDLHFFHFPNTSNFSPIRRANFLIFPARLQSYSFCLFNKEKILSTFYLVDILFSALVWSEGRTIFNISFSVLLVAFVRRRSSERLLTLSPWTTSVFNHADLKQCPFFGLLPLLPPFYSLISLKSHFYLPTQLFTSSPLIHSSLSSSPDHLLKKAPKTNEHLISLSIVEFQMYNTAIWHLYTLRSDHHDKSTNHLSPYKVTTALLTAFPCCTLHPCGLWIV